MARRRFVLITPPIIIGFALTPPALFIGLIAIEVGIGPAVGIVAIILGMLIISTICDSGTRGCISNSYSRLPSNAYLEAVRSENAVKTFLAAKVRGDVHNGPP